MSVGEITIGSFTIGPPYIDGDEECISIFDHKSGEGAEFSKEEFERLIAQFYEENY